MCRFVMCAVSYASMGLVVSWFFGPTIPSSSNLAWTHYRGAGGGAAAEVRGRMMHQDREGFRSNRRLKGALVCLWLTPLLMWVCALWADVNLGPAVDLQVHLALPRPRRGQRLPTQRHHTRTSTPCHHC